MITTADKELKILYERLDKDPTNLDIINSMAITYFENYDLKKDKEDYDCFERAYKLKKTVKSTNNFAWFLFFEWSEIEWRWGQENAMERAFQIQKECIELNPKSYYPYYLYGFMLLEQGQFEEAIPFLGKAYQIEERREIIHNMGYCYFQMNQFQKSKECFSISATKLDLENISLYNLAISEWKLNNIGQVKFIADKLFNCFKTISGYEIGLLYFLLGDFKRASECLVKQGIDEIDLFEWIDLSYSLYITDYEIWKEKLNESITERMKWCDEIKNNHEYWSEYTDKEKREKLAGIEKEIKVRLQALNNGMTKPIIELSENLLIEHCGCLLFDCKTHNNRKND